MDDVDKWLDWEEFRRLSWLHRVAEENDTLLIDIVEQVKSKLIL